MTATFALRADVAKGLEALVSSMPQPASWSDYEYTKRYFSALCGWDAPKGLYDQNQYDAAVRMFAEKAGL